SNSSSMEAARRLTSQHQGPMVAHASMFRMRYPRAATALLHNWSVPTIVGVVGRVTLESEILSARQTQVQFDDTFGLCRLPLFDSRMSLSTAVPSGPRESSEVTELPPANKRGATSGDQHAPKRPRPAIATRLCTRHVCGHGRGALDG